MTKSESRYLVLHNRCLLSSFLFSAVLLAFSYFMEFGLSIKPCWLCKLQRLPLAGILGLSLFGYLTDYKSITLRFVQIAFLAGFALASYHLMVQFGYVNDPCKVPQNISNIDDFNYSFL